MSEIINFTTPVGRLVQGSVDKPQTKDADGNPLVIKHGANAGQPRVDYHLAIAIPKTDAGFNEVYGNMVKAANAGHPTQVAADGTLLGPAFSWKYEDGDSQVANTKGRRPCDREGFPGNWILHFSGGYPPTCFEDQNGQQVQMTDLSKVHTGCYIRINGSVKPNTSQQRPGIYLNHNLVQWVAYGEKIHSGPDANAVFGGPAAPLPAGASATPLAPAVAMAQPAAPAGPALPATAAPALPALPATPAPTLPVAGAPAIPAGAVSPAPEFLNPAAPALPTTPAAPAAPPAAPAEKSYNYNNAVYTHSQLIAGGWAAEQIATLPVVA